MLAKKSAMFPLMAVEKTRVMHTHRGPYISGEGLSLPIKSLEGSGRQAWSNLSRTCKVMGELEGRGRQA